MATKVKGGEIKEGSIPLSALSDEIKTKIETSGGSVTPDWNAPKNESGYINNRTHYIDYGTLREITINADAFDMWEEEDEYGDITRYARSKEMLDYYGTYDIVVKTIDNSYVQPKYNDTILSLSETRTYVHQDDDVEWYIKLEYAYDDEWGKGYKLLLSTQYHWTSVKFYLSDEYGVLIRPLQGYFIPNNIARQDSIDELREETTALWENLDHGTFPNLTAGDLAGRGESVPAEFGFRASGGKSIKDGRAYIKAIKGNSVVWNNMVDTRALQGQLFIATGIRIVKDHKYLLYRTETNQNLYLIPTVNGVEKYEMSIREGEHSGIFQAQYSDDNGKGTVYSEAYCGACIVSDLTQMFQAGNEPSTIEEFNARVATLGVDLNAYNEGEVIHCNTESIKSVGDNAWDEQWENGEYSVDNGLPIDNKPNSIRSKHYIPVIPGAEYYSYNGGNDRTAIIFYDEIKTYISSVIANSGDNKGKFTTPTNARYIRLFSAYGSTYNHDIMISLVHSGWKAEKDDQYQPYWQDTLPLPIIRKYFPNGMKSAGSAHDEIRYNKASGKWEYSKGKIKSVDMGTLNWFKTWYTENEKWRIYANLPSKVKGQNNLLTTKYVTTHADNGTMSDISITGNNPNSYIYIKDSSYSAQGADALIASLQGVILYYESNDWEWVELDAEDQNFRDYYNVADFGTEQSQSAVPSAAFSADIIYQFNAVDMIRENYNEIEKIKAALAKAGITIDL